MIKPKPLHQGDTVAIISPASPTDKNLIDKCVDSLNTLTIKARLAHITKFLNALLALKILLLY